jgi:cytochrome c-type biogenesis protein
MPLDLIGIFGAGLATFLTPCVLPLVPIYLSALVGGNIEDVGAGKRGTLVMRAALFAIGFIAVFTLLGLTASSLGAALTRHKHLVSGVGALLILIFGLKFLGVIRIPFLDRTVKADDTKMTSRFGSVNALVMGVVFAAGWTPCVGPVLGSVLTYAASASSSPWTGAGYLAVYGLGFAVPLMLTATFAEAGMRVMDRIKPHLNRIERVVGVLLIVVAVSMAVDVYRGVTTPQVARDWSTQVTTAKSGKRLPAMVEVYADNCSICKNMKPIVDKITGHCHENKVLVTTVNLSKKKNKGLTRKYRLVGVPTFLFLDKDGNEVARLVGRQSEQGLWQALSALRGESCPGIGPLPSNRRDAPLAFPKRDPNKEEITCPSTSTTATAATKNSNPSNPSRTGTTPSAPRATNEPGACSQGSP